MAKRKRDTSVLDAALPAKSATTPPEPPVPNVAPENLVVSPVEPVASAPPDMGALAALSSLRQQNQDLRRQLAELRAKVDTRPAVQQPQKPAPPPPAETVMPKIKASDLEWEKETVKGNFAVIRYLLINKFTKEKRVFAGPINGWVPFDLNQYIVEEQQEVLFDSQGVRDQCLRSFGVVRHDPIRRDPLATLA